MFTTKNLKRSSQLQIALIGAGVIGLSTAYKIQQDIKDADITIFYAEKSPNTTADISGGFLLPYCCNGEDISRWFQQTMNLMSTLHKRPDALQLGIAPISGCFYGDQPPSSAPNNIRDINENERPFLTISENGYTFTTWTCECKRFLKYLESEFLGRGGKMIQKKIKNFEELNSYDVIINCAGNGAKQLTNDVELTPMRGQVIIVKAPWLKQFVFKERFYILPRVDDVILGGTTQKGNYNLHVDPVDSQQIWEGCCKLEPSVKYSTIVSEEVGLRPYRSKVRLELEKVNLAGKNVALLHNYGHGGAGVSLHWGCALDASNMLQKYLFEKNHSHKL